MNDRQGLETDWSAYLIFGGLALAVVVVWVDQVLQAVTR